MGKSGVGMPDALKLEQFGALLARAFCGGTYHAVFHVGSSLQTTAWRDVDVRVMLPDDRYEALGLGDPERPHSNPRWVALTLALSALGREMTGLPIDCQLQQITHANANHSGGRSALGVRSMVPSLEPA